MTTYRMFDSEEKLGPPPWKHDDPKLIAWEEAHGHDARLNCYPEYACRVAIERADQIEDAAIEVVKKQDAFLAAPEGAPTLYRSHMLSLAIEELKKILFPSGG